MCKDRDHRASPAAGILMAATALIIPSAWAQSGKAPVLGRAELPAVAGHPDSPMIPLKGATLFFSDEHNPTQASYCRDGSYKTPLSPGRYNVLLEPAKPFRRGCYFRDLRVSVNELRWNPTLTPVYNCSFTTQANWHHEPWVWGKLFEQSFLGLRGAVTHVALKLAGVKQGETTLTLSIHKTDTGKQVGPTRTVKAKADEDLYVTWPSNSTFLHQGYKYVLRIKSEPLPVSLFVRRDHGFGFPYGELVVDGKATGADGYFYIGADVDRAVLLYDKHGTKPAGEPKMQWSQIYKGGEGGGGPLAAASMTLHAEQPLGTVTLSIHENNPEGEQVDPTFKAKPVRISEKRWKVGFVTERQARQMLHGQYAFVIESDQPFAPLAAVDGSGLAMRIYGKCMDALPAIAAWPTPPHRVGIEFDEIVPMLNADFETGDASNWESAWGGQPFAAVVDKNWKADKFDAEAARPYEGEYCGVVAADHKPVRKLIRRWIRWEHPIETGLCHARVWVASSKSAATSEDPLTVRVCVSANGSPDAGGVDWSRPITSPGQWTMIESRPIQPKGRKLSVFLLIEGGSEHEEHYVKIDNLQVVVDEK